MTTYHLYFLSRGMLVGQSDIEAGDDEAARIATGRADEATVDVWNEHRRLRVVAPSSEVVA